MTLTYPVPVASFWDLVKPTSSKPWTLSGNTSSSQTDGGETLITARGARLWVPAIKLSQRPIRASLGIGALIETLARGEGTFLAYDMAAPFPANDPTGSILGAALPKVRTLPASLHEMDIKGLPSGYVLSGGDMIGVVTGTGRRALMRVVDNTVTANTSGITPVFQIEPARLSSIMADNAVTLIKPTGKFLIAPGSYDPGTMDSVNVSGASFNMVQVIT